MFIDSDKKNYLIASILILLVVFSRFFFAEKIIGSFGTDPANFTLAVKSYNISQNRPHLPGYFLHIQIIKFLQTYTGNAHSAMILLSILYSSLAIGFLFMFLRHWFEIKISILLTLLILTNPMVWFYGCVPEIYSFSLFFGITLALIGLNPMGIYLTPIFVGLLSGIRPSSGVLIAGLYCFVWYRHIKLHSFSLKKILLSHLIGLAGFLLWFLPMIKTTGGLSKYISLYSKYSPVQQLSILQNWYAFSSYFLFLLPPYIILIIYIVWKNFNHKEKKDNFLNKDKDLFISRDFINMMLMWLIPPALFFFFYHYAKGYFLLCAIPFLTLLILFTKRRKDAKYVLTISIIVQIIIFCFLPYSKPDVRSLFSPAVRKISIPGVWWERTNSVYQMTRSHISTMDKAATELDSIINYLGYSLPDTVQKHFLILIDPTITIHTRALQVRYPEKYFCALSLHKDNQYILYHRLNLTIKKGLKDLFGKAFVISRTDFVANYLKNISTAVKNFGPYSVYKAVPGENEKLIKIYSGLFLR